MAVIGRGPSVVHPTGLYVAPSGFDVPVGMSLMVLPAMLLFVENPDAIRPPTNLQALHAYRGQTTTSPSQPWYLWPKSQLPTEPEPLTVPTDHDRVFAPWLNRTILVSAIIWEKWLPDIEEEVFPARKDQNALFFNRTVPTVTVYQPWYLWQNSRTPEETAPERSPADLTGIHRFRTGFQTVGQPYLAFKGPASAFVEPEAIVPPKQAIYPFGSQAQTTQSTPWFQYNWKSTGFDAEAERTPATDHNKVYAPFVGRQTIVVSQPWNVYRWATPPGDPYEYYEKRPVDYWSMYLPFTLTPTTPPTVQPHYEINLGMMSRLGGFGGG